MTRFVPTALAGVYLLEESPFVDERGSFARQWCGESFTEQTGHPAPQWLQMNRSTNPRRGTLRGMHYQLPPYEEAKLVHCLSGALYDVVVDLRPGSPTLHQWVGVTLEAGRQPASIYIPPGCAHGFLTLADETTVQYFISAPYTPEAARGLPYNDPTIAIDWPEAVQCISERDLNWPTLS